MISELLKDKNFVRLTLTDYKTEITAYISIYKAIQERIEAGSKTNRDCLKLDRFRERDQSTIDFFVEQIQLMKKLEKAVLVLLWAFDNFEFFMSLESDVSKLKERFVNRQNIRGSMVRKGKLFGELIFESTKSEYPLTLEPWIKLVLEAKHI